jgi:hypothetical protein
MLAKQTLLISPTRVYKSILLLFIVYFKINDGKHPVMTNTNPGLDNTIGECDK